MEVHWSNGQIIGDKEDLLALWDNDHAIDFANCEVIDRANFRHRGTL